MENSDNDFKKIQDAYKASFDGLPQKVKELFFNAFSNEKVKNNIKIESQRELIPYFKNLSDAGLLAITMEEYYKVADEAIMAEVWSEYKRYSKNLMKAMPLYYNFAKHYRFNRLKKTIMLDMLNLIADLSNEQMLIYLIENSEDELIKDRAQDALGKLSTQWSFVTNLIKFSEKT